MIKPEELKVGDTVYFVRYKSAYNFEIIKTVAKEIIIENVGHNGYIFRKLRLKGLGEDAYAPYELHKSYEDAKKEILSRYEKEKEELVWAYENSTNKLPILDSLIYSLEKDTFPYGVM